MAKLKVFVRPIPRESVFKIHNFSSNGKSMGKTKVDSMKCRDGIQALYSTKLGALNTGLLEMIENPYKESPSLPEEFKWVAKEDTITRQTQLEIKHNRPKGYYTNRAETRGEMGRERDKTFFQTFVFHLIDGTTIFELDNPDHEIAYYVMLASKLVANSHTEWKQFKWPKALYFISSLDEDEELKFKKSQRIDAAKGSLNDPTVTDEWLIKFAKALELGRGSISKIQAYNLLSEFIDKSRNGTEVNVSKFDLMFNSFKDPAGREELDAKATLMDLIHYGVVTLKGGTYKWWDADESANVIIGERKSEAVDFLINVHKQAEVERMKKQLKAKIIR